MHSTRGNPREKMFHIDTMNSHLNVNITHHLSVNPTLESSPHVKKPTREKEPSENDTLYNSFEIYVEDWPNI